MRRHGVDIGRDDVGFHLVRHNRLGGLAMVHGVDHGQKLPGALGIALGREGHGRPDRSVGILAAVFAHAGDVAFDVAGILGRLVEGRIEQLDECMVATNEPSVERIHRQP